jgi:hypothetical protein
MPLERVRLGTVETGEDVGGVERLVPVHNFIAAEVLGPTPPVCSIP